MPSGWTDAPADDRTFVDTNVLVYAHDASDPGRQVVARTALEDLWATRTGVVSTQVLQEFYAVATSPAKLAFPPALAREVVDLYSTWTVVVVDTVIILAASRLREAESISFWDALIVEAARVGGAGRILSEDLVHGQAFDGVTVANPFDGLAPELRRRG